MSKQRSVRARTRRGCRSSSPSRPPGAAVATTGRSDAGDDAGRHEPTASPRRAASTGSQTTQFNHTGGFDPTGEYLGTDLALLQQPARPDARRLRAQVNGAAGNELVPDLATDLGEVSEDGLTYTFTLKDGVKFGPPRRTATSRRRTSPSRSSGSGPRASSPSTASTTPSSKGWPSSRRPAASKRRATRSRASRRPTTKTISFTLTEPTGDFLYRLAMPAAGPIPPEVAGCFKQAGEYGRYVISSGPYMLEGSDELDATSCDTLEAGLGLRPEPLHALRAESELRPGHRRDAADLRRRLRLLHQHEPAGHLQQDRGG